MPDSQKGELTVPGSQAGSPCLARPWEKGDAASEAFGGHSAWGPSVRGCARGLSPLVHAGPMPFKGCTALGTLTLPRLPHTLPLLSEAPLTGRTRGRRPAGSAGGHSASPASVDELHGLHGQGGGHHVVRIVSAHAHHHQPVQLAHDEDQVVLQTRALVGARATRADPATGS